MLVFSVYDSGTIFSPAVLDITDEDIKKSFMVVSALDSLRTLVYTLTQFPCTAKANNLSFANWTTYVVYHVNGHFL